MKLRIQKHIAFINLVVWVAAVASLLIPRMMNKDTGITHAVAALVMTVVFLAVTMALSTLTRHATRMLDLDGKTVVYWFGLHHGLGDLPTFVARGPMPIKEAVEQEPPFVKAIAKIVVPLRRNGSVEVSMKHDSDELRQFNLWQIELVEAHWNYDESSNECSKTILRLIDARGITLEASLEQAMQLMSLCDNLEGRNRHFVSALISFAQREADLRRENEKLRCSLQETDTKLHRATGALIEGVNRLRNRDKFPRVRKPARALANDLAGVLVTILADNDRRRGTIIPDTDKNENAEA